MEDTEPNVFSQPELESLADAHLIYLATLRRDGTQSRPAPLWFTIGRDRTILIQSGPASWRVKRIERGNAVVMWIERPPGTAFVSRAEISNDPAVINQIVEDFRRKYLLARIGLYRPARKHFEQGKKVAIRIRPINRLPEGFPSEPGKQVSLGKERGRIGGQ